ATSGGMCRRLADYTPTRAKVMRRREGSAPPRPRPSPPGFLGAARDEPVVARVRRGGRAPVRGAPLGRLVHRGAPAGLLLLVQLLLEPALLLLQLGDPVGGVGPGAPERAALPGRAARAERDEPESQQQRGRRGGAGQEHLDVVRLEGVAEHV